MFPFEAPLAEEDDDGLFILSSPCRTCNRPIVLEGVAFKSVPPAPGTLRSKVVTT